MTATSRPAGSRRRSNPGPRLVTIYWRDIPAQVTATADGVTEKSLLPARFQNAIDKAARVAGLTDRHDYIQQWRRETRTLAPVGDLAGAVADEARRIDTEHDRDTLAALVRGGGLRDAPGEGR